MEREIQRDRKRSDMRVRDRNLKTERDRDRQVERH
jgi:hypothetical protein